MSDPDPRRRKPTARPNVPQPGGADDHFLLPPALTPRQPPNTIPPPDLSPFPEDVSPPGYSSGLPEDDPPPGFANESAPEVSPPSYLPVPIRAPISNTSVASAKAAHGTPSERAGQPLPNAPHQTSHPVSRAPNPTQPGNFAQVPPVPTNAPSPVKNPASNSAAAPAPPSSIVPRRRATATAPSEPAARIPPHPIAHPRSQTEPTAEQWTNEPIGAKGPIVKAALSNDELYGGNSPLAGIDLPKVATRFAPPWLISMVVHIVVLLVLAMIQLGQVIHPMLVLEATYADRVGEQMLDDSILTTALDTVENVEAAFSKDVNPAENPLAAMPQLDIALQTPGVAANLEAPSIGIALTGREKGAKEALLSAYGGNAVTEGSVAMALEWLKRQQQKDGSWSLAGPFTNGVTVDNKAAATAMALLAFQGNGDTHQKGTHRAVVEKGARALLKMQDKDGNFVHEGISGHRLYAQAMASIVVCELYAMTKDPEVKVAAERALSYAAKIQADDGQGGGGWRYHPGQDVDTSVTGWFVMAYQSGRMAGLDQHAQTLQRVSAYLDHVEKVEVEFNSIKDISYYYRVGEDPRLSMTAEALLCRQYLGWDRNEPRLLAGVKKILQPENRIRWDEPNFYYWYYATQVMHHMGGNEWHEWNQVMREVLPKAQEKSGRERGSWSPAGDEYGYQGGRMYSTCFCVFMLESYYRHLPLYKHGH